MNEESKIYVSKMIQKIEKQEAEIKDCKEMIYILAKEVLFLQDIVISGLESKIAEWEAEKWVELKNKS